MYVCMYVCMYIYIYIYIYICVCVYIMYVCMYVCTYILMYIHTLLVLSILSSVCLEGRFFLLFFLVLRHRSAKLLVQHVNLGTVDFLFYSLSLTAIIWISDSQCK